MDPSNNKNEPTKAEENLAAVGHETTSQTKTAQDSAVESSASGNLTAAGQEATQQARESFRESSASQVSNVSEESERASLKDDASIASQKSGVSKLAERVGDLTVKSTGFVFMDGPTKRRFKMALKQGLSREAALAAAQTAPEENRGNTDRNKGSTNKPKDVAPKPTKGRPKPTYSQALSCIKLGITPVDPVKSPMSSEEMEIVKKAIKKELREKDDAEKHPEFEAMSFKSGWMIITCSNEDTAVWLRARFDKVKATSGLDITLVEQDKFPKTYIVNGFFGSSEDETNEDMLTYIGNQNKGLPAKSWQVISRTREGQMDHLVLGMDQESWKMLDAVGGKIAYLFGHMRLNLGRKRNAMALGQADSEPTTEKTAKAPPAQRATPLHSEEKKRRVDPKQGLPSGGSPKPGPSTQARNTQERKQAQPVAKPSEKPTKGKKKAKSEDGSPSGRRQTRQGARANSRQTLITASYRKDAR